MKIDLTDLDVFNAKDFFKQLDIENNKILDSTGPGEWMKQTIPSIYFTPNEFYEIVKKTAIEGMQLTIASTEKMLVFCYEIYESPFIKYFDSAKHKFASFLKINRNDIIGYKKDKEVKFTAVNPKKSYEVMGNMGGAPISGLIMPSLIKGAFKLAGNLEKETIEKTGTIYSLEFTENDTIKSINIICESFYLNELDKFLNEHWIKEMPIIQNETESKGGCFIATACYGDYDDPNVLILRKFRDEVLAKSKIGKSFITLYYKYSPSIAKKIESNNTLKTALRNILIYPLVKITSKIK